MTTELRNIINDLNKAHELKNALKEVKSFKIDPIEEIINYAFKNSIINFTLDVLEISKEVPDEISHLVAVRFDNKNSENTTNSYYNNDYRYKYAGTYKSLDELNAKFGTDFNYRCIPDGAIITGYNDRC